MASTSASVTSALTRSTLNEAIGLKATSGKHLERRDVGEILALGHALRLDARAAGGREVILRHCLREARLHELADHLAMHLLPELPPDHGERRLAGPKALQARGAAQLLQARGNLLADSLGRHLHLHAALQLADTLHGNLHVDPLYILGRESVEAWCERRDSNSHGLPHQVLSLARLPIPPHSHSETALSQQRIIPHPAGFAVRAPTAAPLRAVPASRSPA